MILDEILAHKRLEVQAAKQRLPLSELTHKLTDAPPVRPFTAALRRADGRIGLIAEVKKASPSAGVIRADFDPVAIAQEYEQAGADCLSVLTDERYFQGHLDYLKNIRAMVALPLLRKEFVIDEYQIYEARTAGADAILLIVSALSFAQLRDFQALAQHLGMDALVETHDEDEMHAAAKINAPLIGINSRDLRRFVTDLSVIERLAKLAPPAALLVGESGIKTPDDVRRLMRVGVQAILVGETLMRAQSISEAIAGLLPVPVSQA